MIATCVTLVQNPFDHLYRDHDVEGMTDGYDKPTAYGHIDGIDDPTMGWARYAQVCCTSGRARELIMFHLCVLHIPVDEVATFYRTPSLAAQARSLLWIVADILSQSSIHDAASLHSSAVRPFPCSVVLLQT